MDHTMIQTWDRERHKLRYSPVLSALNVASFINLRMSSTLALLPFIFQLPPTKNFLSLAILQTFFEASLDCRLPLYLVCCCYYGQEILQSRCGNAVWKRVSLDQMDQSGKVILA